jgi:hypothetical protein
LRIEFCMLSSYAASLARVSKRPSISFEAPDVIRDACLDCRRHTQLLKHRVVHVCATCILDSIEIGGAVGALPHSASTHLTDQ